MTTNDSQSSPNSVPVRKVRKAVLPAAGLGTRFLPATKAQPKEMLTVVDKPQIQYVAEECVASGIEHIIIVTGRGKSAIEDHFDASPFLADFLEKHGKKQQAKMVRDISDMVQLIDVYEATGVGAIAVEEVPRDRTQLYGIVAGEPAPQPPFGARLLRIRDLVEKPKPENAPSNLAITGRYILPPAIFDCLERTKPGAGNEIQLTDGLRTLAQEQGLWAYIYEGTSYDAGDKLGFLKATAALALLNPELGADFPAYFKTLKL